MAEILLTLDHMTLSLKLPDGVSADPKLLDGGHPLHYVLKMRGQTQTYLNKVHELLADLGPMNVLEFCAGIGLVHATNPQLRDSTHSWFGVELDPSCQPLADKIAPNMRFMLGDMYYPLYTKLSFKPPEETLVICEFSNNTLPKMWREPKRADLIRRIAREMRPRYWYIADVGYYWIHLSNHWPIYEAQFGVKPTRENYHELFDLFMRQNYGYKVVKWTVGGGAQYFLMEVL